MTTYTQTLDGVTNFTDIWGNTIVWGPDSWIDWFHTGEPTATESLTANFYLTGSDWTVATMDVWAENGTSLTLTDLDAGTGRRIHYLRLGYNSDVDLISTSVDHLEGWDGAKHDVVLGSGYTKSVSLYADVNKLTIGSGGVDLVTTGGRDTIRIGSGGAGLVDTGDRRDIVLVRNGGGVDSIDTGRGNDRVTVDGAYVDNVQLGAGNDTVTLRNSAFAHTLVTDGGENAVTVQGDSWAEFIDLSSGDGDIKVLGGSGIDSVEMDSGTYSVSVDDGFIGSILAYAGAELDLDVANGSVASIKTDRSLVDLHIADDAHVAQINLYGDVAGRHKVVAEGWLGTLLVGLNGVDVVTKSQGAETILLCEERDTVRTGSGHVQFISTREGNDFVKIGAGGADTVRTGDGHDVVKTGSGYVELINTGDGNDNVTLGSGVLGHLRLGDGDDYVAVSETDPKYGDILWGEGGTDTVDFSAFSVGVTVDLGFNGWQNIGATPVGFFQLMGLENAIGNAQADKLIGDAHANTLRGLGGNDRLLGGGGQDRLIGANGKDMLKGGSGADTLLGGKGNDTLVGGVGADVFAFAANAGTDTVTDFQDGTDLLQISGHSGGFGALDFDDVKGDLKITHDGGTIILEGLAGTTLGADDFAFV